jgi:cell division protein FtsZ
MVDPEADIIWGSAYRAELDGRIRVSIVATGLDQAAGAAPVEARAPVVLPPVAAPTKVAAPVRKPAPAAAAPALRRLPPLAPPAPGIEIPTVDPFAPVAAAAAAPPLFERMAAIARGASAAGIASDTPSFLTRGGDVRSRRLHA